MSAADVACARCGEPWNVAELTGPNWTADERAELLRGEGCPCCLREGSVLAAYMGPGA